MTWIWSRGLVTALMAAASLATAAYAAGVVSLFLPGEPLSWRDNFAGNVLIWMYIPFSLWLLYMYARVTLGRRLLEQRRAEEALAWSLPRVMPNIWLRTQREALVHRVVVAQALLRLGRWDQAHAMLNPPASLLPADVAERSELARWRAELFLRRDELEQARVELEAHKPGPRATAAQRAALLACMAELALLDGDIEQARKHLQDAQWRDAGCVRASLVAAMMAARTQTARPEVEGALARLIAAHEALVEELPARRGELWALRAQLHTKLDQADAAAQARVAAKDALSDAPDGRAERAVQTLTQEQA